MQRRRFLAITLATLAAGACTPSVPARPTVWPATPSETKPAEADAVQPTEAARPAESAVPGAAPAQGNTAASKITFWHAVTGVNGDALAKMVDGFNKSQRTIAVEAIFQGGYDAALAKLKTALASKSAPALIQVSDIGQRFLIDSGEVVPMQQFIDAEQYDTSDFEQNVLACYKVEDKLYGMPFITNSSILYYNKDAFTAAGLDPSKPPTTYAEVADHARKLVKKDGNNISSYGFHQAISGWLFEQHLAVSGGLYVDQGNGRDARATRAVYNDDRGALLLNWWKAGVDGGYFGNFGRVPLDSAAAFDAGKSAMYVESTARMRGHINASQNKFELGTGFFPRPENAPNEGGNILGGAGVYLLKNRPLDEQQAAWEFVKYSTSAPVQAQWLADTGYYPVRKAAYNETISQEWVGKYPQFNAAVDQLRSVPVNRITQGAVFGVFPQARQRVEAAIEEVLVGKSDAKSALDRAAEEISGAIDTYNKSAP